MKLHQTPLTSVFLSASTTTAILWPLFRSVCVSRHPQWRTRGFCWSCVLLPTCHCWWHLGHLDYGENARVSCSVVILVFSARKSEHITPLLCELHWLRVPERIKFRPCVLAFRCLHGTAPRYLAETLHLTTSRGSCSRLCSAATSTLIVPATRRRTMLLALILLIFYCFDTVHWVSGRHMAVE